VTHRIDSVEQLRSIYRAPSPLVIAKARPVLDAATQAFLAATRLVVLSTVGSDGSVDASPRGGPAGFIDVIDERTIAIADLSGNNRLDTLENIVATGRLAMLAIVPGQTETVRVNGACHLSIDPEILSRSGSARPPKTAIVIDVHETYIHCAKAFMRGDVWDPQVWSSGTPDAADIIACQGLVDVSADVIRAGLADSYVSDLAAGIA
jgi:uncharacterized protein